MGIIFPALFRILENLLLKLSFVAAAGIKIKRKIFMQSIAIACCKSCTVFL